MKEIEIYVHTHDGPEPKSVKVDQTATVKQLIEKLNAAVGIAGSPHEEILVFLEDCEHPVEHHRKLDECEVRHKHHVHCHRCHRINVSVYYNDTKQHTFAPSTKVKHVLKWAVKAFTLTPAEAADKILTLKGDANQELDPDAHIGSFAKPHECSVQLCLTAPVEVQG